MALPIERAASSEDQLEALRALRALLALHLQKTDSARDVAALSRQMTDVLKQIAELKAAQPEQKGTPLDELAKRRAEAAS